MRKSATSKDSRLQATKTVKHDDLLVHVYGEHRNLRPKRGKDKHLRVIALDIGKKRTGIAASDASAKVASPVKVLDSADVFANSKNFRYLIEDYEPELIVVGLPLSMDGQENEHAAWVREQAKKIGLATGIDVEFVDERLSSIEAKRIMHEEGLTERDMRGKLDMVAASIFLQSYLDSMGV